MEMKMLWRLVRRLQMELEIAAVWAGVEETVAVLPFRTRDEIRAKCQAEEEAIRAKYQ
jgi:hypothetical protein